MAGYARIKLDLLGDGIRNTTGGVIISHFLATAVDSVIPTEMREGSVPSR